MTRAYRNLTPAEIAKIEAAALEGNPCAIAYLADATGRASLTEAPMNALHTALLALSPTTRRALAELHPLTVGVTVDLTTGAEERTTACFQLDEEPLEWWETHAHVSDVLTPADVVRMAGRTTRVRLPVVWWVDNWSEEGSGGLSAHHRDLVEAIEFLAKVQA